MSRETALRGDGDDTMNSGVDENDHTMKLGVSEDSDCDDDGTIDTYQSSVRGGGQVVQQQAQAQQPVTGVLTAATKPVSTLRQPSKRHHPAPSVIVVFPCLPQSTLIL
jgi:hypothetical protein